LKPSRAHTFRALFVPFPATRGFLSRNECHSILFGRGRKNQRHHRRLRCMLCGRYCLRVNVQRGAERRMPQQLPHHLALSPHASQQGRVGVPERMPSESLLNSDSLRGGTDVFAQDRLAPVRSSAPIALACKNPVIGLDEGTRRDPETRRIAQATLDRTTAQHHGPCEIWRQIGYNIGGLRRYRESNFKNRDGLTTSTS
jgi:hypothetical protein